MMMNVSDGVLQLTRALTAVERHEEQVTKILKFQSERTNWKDIKFPVSLNDTHNFENKESINIRECFWL
jgi:hypothetical protein